MSNPLEHTRTLAQQVNALYDILTSGGGVTNAYPFGSLRRLHGRIAKSDSENREHRAQVRTNAHRNRTGRTKYNGFGCIGEDMRCISR